MIVKAKQFFKHNVAIKITSTLLVVGSILSIPLQAEAYYRFGRIWTSTAGQKYPTVLAGNFNTSMVQVSNSMNQKWGGLPNSTLQTGTLYVSNSITAYENASFTMVFGDNVAMYANYFPAITVTCVGCNWAHVALSSNFVWSNRFADSSASSSYLGYVDSSTVILHELGHSYGLDHPDEDPSTP